MSVIYEDHITDFEDGAGNMLRLMPNALGLTVSVHDDGMAEIELPANRIDDIIQALLRIKAMNE